MALQPDQPDLQLFSQTSIDNVLVTAMFVSNPSFPLTKMGTHIDMAWMYYSEVHSIVCFEDPSRII